MCFDNGGEPDLKDRDPYNINQHIQVQFADVLSEREGAHSFDCIWQGSECCYTFFFTICYGLPTGLCHICISLGWGLEFGLSSYLHIWCFQPFIRLAYYVCYAPTHCFRICVRCILDPWCESCAYLFLFFEDDPLIYGSRRPPPVDADREKRVREKNFQPMAIF